MKSKCQSRGQAGSHWQPRRAGAVGGLRRAATGSCPIGRSARGGTKLNVVSTVSPTIVLLQSAFFVVTLVISTL